MRFFQSWIAFWGLILVLAGAMLPGMPVSVPFYVVAMTLFIVRAKILLTR